jgi:hypothetical protein
VGSSNLGYRDAGFWVSDYQAEVWLYLLAQQARAMADAPPGSLLLRATGCAGHGWFHGMRLIVPG